MEHSQATLDAYDGVEIRLTDRTSVRAEALSVVEAIQMLGTMARIAETGNMDIHARFLAEFYERFNIRDVTLAQLGLEFGGVDGSSLTVAATHELAQLYIAACRVEGWRAQSECLDRFPALLGLGSDVAPGDVFEAAAEFAEAFHRAIYALAQTFLHRLISTPGVRALELEGTTQMTSTQASTT